MNTDASWPDTNTAWPRTGFDKLAGTAIGLVGRVGVSFVDGRTMVPSVTRGQLGRHRAEPLALYGALRPAGASITR